MDVIKKFFLGNREPAYSDKLPTQLLLGCRALVGGYLYYTIAGLKDGILNPESQRMQIFLIAAAVLFAVFGGLLLYDSLRNFAIGRYVGGKLDLGEKPSESEVSDDVADDSSSDTDTALENSDSDMQDTGDSDETE